MIDPENKVRRVSGVMMAGIICIAASAVFIGLTLFTRQPGAYILGMMSCPVGIVLCIIALASGWRQAFGDPSKSPIQRALDIYVVAKIVLDENADVVLDAGAYDPAELKYLVQIQMPGGRTREFDAPYQVFEQIGEGMRGDIVFQGRWLSQFVFKPKPKGGDPIDPFSRLQPP